MTNEIKNGIIELVDEVKHVDMLNEVDESSNFDGYQLNISLSNYLYELDSFDEDSIEEYINYYIEYYENGIAECDEEELTKIVKCVESNTDGEWKDWETVDDILDVYNLPKTNDNIYRIINKAINTYGESLKEFDEIIKYWSQVID